MDEEDEVLFEYDACVVPTKRPVLLAPNRIRNPLRKAVAKGDVAKIRCHLRNNHDVNLVDNLGHTCVHTAVLYGNLASLRFLASLEETRLNVQDNLGETPLLCAVRNEVASNTAAFLIENGCDVMIANAVGVTPLHVAARRSDERLVRLLIEAGADVNAVDAHDITPLCEAVVARSPEIVCALLFHGAAPSVNPPPLGSPMPFQVAVAYEIASLAELLLDFVADVRTKHKPGGSDFSLAVRHEMDVAVRIVDRGGDVYETSAGIPLIFTLLTSKRDLFRKLWQRVDAVKMFASSSPRVFLPYFLQNVYFSGEETLGILEEVLFSVDEYHYNYYEADIYRLVYELCGSAETRLKWTWTLLSYDIPIRAREVEYLYEKYGFCTEIAAILSSETIIYRNSSNPFVLRLIYNDTVGETVPEGFVPSLMLAARDVCRKFIFSKYQREPNYMAYNVIMGLNLPNLVKDILVLKWPLRG